MGQHRYGSNSQQFSGLWGSVLSSTATIAPTRQYHSRLLIQPSLVTGAMSNSPALDPVFNVTPSFCKLTAACCRLGSESLTSSLIGYGVTVKLDSLVKLS